MIPLSGGVPSFAWVFQTAEFHELRCLHSSRRNLMFNGHFPSSIPFFDLILLASIGLTKERRGYRLNTSHGEVWLINQTLRFSASLRLSQDSVFYQTGPASIPLPVEK